MTYWRIYFFNLMLLLLMGAPSHQIAHFPKLALVANGHGRADSTLDIKIKRKLLTYSQERVRLSLEYLEKRHGLKKTAPTIDPKMIVVHYTNGGTIESIYRYFNTSTIEDSREYNKKQSSLNVSSHYLIDRDGTIYQLVEDTLFARHTIGLNYCSIGIENIGGPTSPLTTQQIRSNASLIRHLTSKYKIDHVIGHSEYLAFRNSTLWKETDKKYYTIKQDPGEKAMQEIRVLIDDLKVSATPK